MAVLDRAQAHITPSPAFARRREASTAVRVRQVHVILWSCHFWELPGTRLQSHSHADEMDYILFRVITDALQDYCSQLVRFYLVTQQQLPQQLTARTYL